MIGIAGITAIFFLKASFFSSLKELSQKILFYPAKIHSDINGNFRSRRKLIKENKILHKKIGDLFMENGRFKQMNEENARLRTLLEFKQRTKLSMVSAEVIAKNPNNWINSFIIDKGFVDGIPKNSAVCSAKGLLGRVSEVDKDTSSVMLITHPAFKCGGMLRDSRIHGIVVGTGSEKVKMLYLPPDAEIEEEDVVVTSNFSRIFPKGIIIGEIVSAGKSDTGLYKYAIIRLYANPFDQEEVLCVK